MDDRPTKRKYSRTECERRFVLDHLPADLDPEAYERLEDLFVGNTYLRLREVRRPDGAWIVTKLGQKVVDPEAPDDARRRQMTTIYLPESEAAVFAALAGLRTTKRRYKKVEQGLTFCIDVWENPASARGTIVAEVEAPSIAELERVAVPSWVRAEVTNDPQYSAITLAALPNASRD